MPGMVVPNNMDELPNDLLEPVRDLKDMIKSE